MQTTAYDTLTAAIEGLRSQGYTEDFNVAYNCLECRSGSIQLPPDEFQIDGFYRFEGQTDPADESIVYAISSGKHGLKGVLVNGFGISADEMASELLAKLNTTA